MKRTSLNSEDKKFEKGKSTIIKLDKAKVKYFDYSELGHFASECKKPRYKGKEKALMTTQKDWTDSSSSEYAFYYENIALMAYSTEKSNSSRSLSVSSSQGTRRMLGFILNYFFEVYNFVFFTKNLECMFSHCLYIIYCG